MHVVGALISINRFEIQHAPHDAELVRDAIATMHVARERRDRKGLAAIVALDETDHLRRQASIIEESADAHAACSPSGALVIQIFAPFNR